MSEHASVQVREDRPIIEVLRAINESASRFALVVDAQTRLVGIATDGDIRRGFIDGASVNDAISTVMNSSPLVAKETLTEEAVGSLLTERINHIPVVDEDGRVKGVISYSDRSVALDAKSRSVCVVGMGYVGVTMSVVLADAGFTVYGYDIDEALVDSLRNGQLPFHEVGLEAYLHRNLGVRLHAVSSLDEVDADVYVVTVGTPVDPGTKRPRIEYVEAAARTIGGRLNRGDLVVLRSTVPVGVTRNVVLPVLEAESGLRAGDGFLLSFAPERTVEGSALPELRQLPQVVGGFNKKSTAVTSRLFAEMTSTIIDAGSLEGAEMVKILNNTFRDVKFAYANEMALMGRELGLDLHRLIKAANDGYPRDRIPVPSPGVGGPCLTKDGYLLKYSAQGLEAQPRMSLLAREVNERIPHALLEVIENFLKGLGKPRVKVVLIGLAFKGQPETSDLRDSTALVFSERLQRLSDPEVDLFGYDAVVEPVEIEAMGLTPCSVEAGFDEADAVLILNNHRSHPTIDIFDLLTRTSRPCLFLDGWRAFDPDDVREVEHIQYLGVGSD
jgi:UDP-N-acetyl-D-mannosaminuronic acid dehydrogenase